MSKKRNERALSDALAPRHYRAGKIQPLDFIEDQNLDFALGNVVKYVCRAGKKLGNSELEDLCKAQAYLIHKIAKLEEN